jgi:hypothetical protein
LTNYKNAAQDAEERAVLDTFINEEQQAMNLALSLLHKEEIELKGFDGQPAKNQCPSTKR